MVIDTTPTQTPTQTQGDDMTVVLSGEAVTALREIALRRGVSDLGEVLLKAISHEKFLVEEADKGSRLLIQRPDQPLREFVVK
jgi:hypothetical protein